METVRSVYFSLKQTGKFNICNQDREKKTVKIVILHIETNSRR